MPNPGEGFSELEVLVSGQCCANCTDLNQLFSTGGDFITEGHLAMSGDKVGCHTGGWGAAVGGWQKLASCNVRDSLPLARATRYECPRN